MDTVQSQITGFHREYLRELSVPEIQLLALADAIPEEAYGWRPAGDARSFSEVLVHIGAGNLMLLYRAGVHTADVMDLCSSIEGEGVSQWLAIVHKSLMLERTVTRKAAVIDLLKRSFEAVRQSFTTASEEDLETARNLFGEVTTRRRFYLRILAHSDEHMGQAIAYVRSMGVKVPWPNPVKEMERAVAAAASA